MDQNLLPKMNFIPEGSFPNSEIFSSKINSRNNNALTNTTNFNNFDPNNTDFALQDCINTTL